MKKLIAVLLLAGAAFAAYYFLVMRTPEARICDRMSELCGAESDAESCEADLESARDAVGDAAIEDVASCVDEADTCIEAAACTATGLIRGASEEALEGIQKGLQRAFEK
ncbi:hypothetical protein [Haliangium ochraceum]|uniref:Uncharacterized protein n=1 Tax=Haliangium ochraceum (strain DSM 14365 / JCM 11303 / SMP-2) TaxID=502025 RepID=D0LHB8_HALO1|nr:hypothetical protein [Haliangium ochraceum]ACY18263.1 hypothetical protein Hoch_5786 [Haliangium ochraceum DSM 14365]